jgi:hypothetical protein
MACSTCNKNRTLQQVQITPPEPQECVYSFEELTSKLELVLQDPNRNTLHTFYLKSAINFYSKNCNKFNKQLSAFM